MARRRYRKKRGSSRAKSIPILPIVPLVAVGLGAMSYSGTPQAKMNYVAQKVAGVNVNDGSFSFASMAPFATSMLIGVVGHKVANKTGINSYVRRATMGYLSL